MAAAGPAPAQEPSTSGERPRRVPTDPPPMSITEKLACEWEARHDVVARRRISDVAPVQHYLSHARTTGRSATSGSARRASPAAPPAEQPAAPPAARAHDVPSGLRSWLRWGEEGGPEHPVIPRC